MSIKIFPLVLLFAFTISFSDSARILAVFPVPSISHQVVFRPLTQELARRGHDVVVITPDPAFTKGQAPKNLTEIDVHEVSYTLWRKELLKTVKGDKDAFQNQAIIIFELINTIIEMQFKTQEVQEIIFDKKQQFDLLILEACTTAILALKRIFQVPVIQISSLGAVFGSHESLGAPTHPLLYPSTLRQRLYNLTKWEKITELYNYYKYENMIDDYEKNTEVMIKRVFGVDIPSLSELKTEVDVVFLNVHPIWDDNHPVPPNIVYTWGLHQKPHKALPQDFQSFMDSSKHGVIYMSFGTNTNPSLLPPEKIQIFVRVFSQLPYDILWKWDKDELPGQTKNIRIGKWFPQSDLLRHPNLKLFITQGGLQSTDEAIVAGVPLVGIPMSGDQWYNIEKYVFHKIGVKLEMMTLTEKEFRNAIDTVIGDESYCKNIINLRELMQDQPQSALERAVWWTEHVLRHGGARHFRAPAANMSWSQYLEIELVATVLIAVLVATVSTISIFFLLYKYVSRIFLNSFKFKIS